MNTRKGISIIGLLLAFAIILPVARADEFDQASKLTFNQSVQVPGRVLPAGTYWFVLIDHGFDLNVVQIYNSDRSQGACISQTPDCSRQGAGQASYRSRRGLNRIPQPRALSDWRWRSATASAFFAANGLIIHRHFLSPGTADLKRNFQRRCRTCLINPVMLTVIDGSGAKSQSLLAF